MAETAEGHSRGSVSWEREKELGKCWHIVGARKMEAAAIPLSPHDDLALTRANEEIAPVSEHVEREGAVVGRSLRGSHVTHLRGGGALTLVVTLVTGQRGPCGKMSSRIGGSPAASC